jgi:transcriptional regulator with GAF, ATPase, and Fis domain
MAHLRGMIESTAATAIQVALEDVEADHIRQVLKETYWRIAGRHGAAKRLAINPSTLRSRMKKLGIEKPSAEDAQR